MKLKPKLAACCIAWVYALLSGTDIFLSSWWAGQRAPGVEELVWVE